ncbi:hypothetical protein Q8F55_006760 [Vanrija albida]|uniref:Inosine/uridine-preferring nucleoside hydrolase domain-containing protein n=1 Tax=Vanrija albida TaxID=181172 RepID=A0ABR3PY35_9TREE
MAPHKIIIDTDPGVDDVLAILLALSSPEVEVALITAVYGNTHAPMTFDNLLKMYYNLGLEFAAHPESRKRFPLVSSDNKTLVAIGEDGPIGGEKHVATYFHGPDGLSNISETHPEFTPPPSKPEDEHEFVKFTSRKGWEAILDVLRAEPEGTVSVVALGPLTNVAWAAREDPETFKRVAEVVWMGGALDVPGNTSPVAEFNCFADPYAFAFLLDEVKKGAFRLVFAPLDITSPHMIPFSDLLHPALIGEDATGVAPPTPLQAFATSFLRRVRGLQAKFGLPDAMEMHDPVAVWYAIANRGRSDLASGWAVKGRAFSVERNGEITRGMCVVDRRGTGETTGGTRTENEELKSSGLNDESAEALKTEEKVESEGESSEPLPLAMVGTPGTPELRRLLLGRVFGTAV